MNIVSTVLCRKDIGNSRVSAQGKSKVIYPWPPQVPCLFKIVETLLLFVASATDPELKCFKVRQKMSTLPQLAEARKNPGTSHVYLLCASCGAKSGVLITLADFSCCLHTLQQYDFIDEATRYIKGTAGKYVPLHHGPPLPKDTELVLVAGLGLRDNKFKYVRLLVENKIS